MGVRRWLSSEERILIYDEIRRLPRLTNASVEGARVLATGIVRAVDAPLTAPLSQRPCVRYTSFAGTFEAEGSQRFELVRGDGDAILVDPAHARLDISPLPVRAFESDHAYRIRLAHRDADGWATPVETVVADGMRIAIAAWLVRETVATAAYRDGVTALVLAGTADVPLVIFSFYRL